MRECLGEKDDLIGGGEVILAVVGFTDFDVDTKGLDLGGISNGGAVNIGVALFPNGEAEIPEVQYEGGGEMSCRITIMESSLAVVVIVCAEPRGGVTATQEVRPADGVLVVIGAFYKPEVWVIWIRGPVEGGCPGKEICLNAMENALDHGRSY